MVYNDAWSFVRDLSKTEFETKSKQWFSKLKPLKNKSCPIWYKEKKYIFHIEHFKIVL